MQEIKLLSDELIEKVNKIASRFDDLEAENKQLKEQNKALKEKIENLKVKVGEQVSQLATEKLAELIKQQGKQTEVKLKINELVKKIDACIKMLND